VPFLLTLAAGAVVSLLAWVRTPDTDRPRVFPGQPALWGGITGTPAPLRHALGTLLFWSLFAAGFGAGGVLVALVAPDSPVLAVGAGIAVGLLTSVSTASRMLKHGPGAMKTLSFAPKNPVGERPRVLFMCGSQNQTGQMLQIAAELPEVEAWFAPYYSDDPLTMGLMKGRFLDQAINGHKRRGICVDELNARGKSIDFNGERNAYDLWLSPNDAVVPPGLAGTPWVLVQEGIMEQPNWRTWVWRHTRLFPRPLATTAVFGLSRAYDKFCVASEGYRRKFVEDGVPAAKLVVTGIPNFDDFARFRDNDFPHHHYVLVCTSDGRETMMKVDRPGLLRKSVALAAGRQLIFKLHPNENVERATREILEIAPNALVFPSGNAEEMVANCEVLITEHSSLTFCGLALGKEVHTNFPIEEVRKLLPVQNRRAAQEIADVVRGLLGDRLRDAALATPIHRKAS
jgi:hypothetical protein